MAASFNNLLKKLKGELGKTDEGTPGRVEKLLLQLAIKGLPLNQSLLNYHETLLFISAYPSNARLKKLIEKELARIAANLKEAPKKSLTQFANTGLPFTVMTSNYSHDCISWLRKHPQCRIDLISQSYFSLNDILCHTLPTLERSNTTAGFNNQEILEVLGIRESQHLDFYLSQFETLNDQPTIKDSFFDKLELEIGIKGKNKHFSRTYNRIPVSSIFYQQDWIKHFDVHELLNRPLPYRKENSPLDETGLILSIKNAMALNDRETDPVTYMDPLTLRVFELERGITVAIYGMTSLQQLPMESYVGYTLFKNGIPTAYGGTWVFGERANFGINIFEAFRGGESGYVMCQLLRVYRMTFGISYFEIEPYQFGLDNPEGIATGAFWFYYRYGFRPLDRALNALANTERKKIKLNKSYKTSKTTLIRFTQSNMVLDLARSTPLSLPSITKRITKMIQSQFNGDRNLAVQECTNSLKSKVTVQSFSPIELKVFQEMALVSYAMKVTNTESFKLLTAMSKAKPVDLYEYQQLLLKFLKIEMISK